MAIAAIAGLASVGSAMVAAGTFAIGFAAAATAFAIGAGLSIISRALMPKPDFGAMMQGVTGTVREATASRKVIYGKVRVGGAVVFIANSNQNKDLYLIICFACHEIESYEEIYFNDKLVWSNGSYQSDWASYANFGFYKGDQTTADSVMVNASSVWTTDHKLLGIAYLRVRLTWDEDRKKFPQGVPNISAVIKGKKLFDPRTNSTSWSQNPALVMRDYLTNDYYGLGAPAADMNAASFIAAANVCDTQISLSEGGTHNKYHCDGVLDTANTIKSNIEALTASMGGRIAYLGGEYYVQAARYVAPSITIDESMMIGPIKVQTKQSRRSLYNGVKGVFLSEEENYTLCDYPAKTSSTYEAQDGDPVFLDMPLPFVTNNVRAQRLAKIALLKSRQQVVVTVPLNLSGLRFKAGDFIAITNSRLNYTAKAFEVIGYDLSINQDNTISVNLQAIETQQAVYDWTTNTDQDVFNSPTGPSLSDGTTVDPPTSLSLTETTQLQPDGSIIPALQVSWTLSVDAFIEFYEVEVVEVLNGVEQTAQTIYNTVKGDVNSILVIGVRAGAVTYKVTVRAVNTIGVKSTDLTNSSLFQLSGDTTAPAAPTSLAAAGSFKQINLTWTNPSDLDLKEVVVYRSNTSGGTYTEIGISGGETFLDQILTNDTTRYYKVKARDFSGNLSDFSNSASGTTAQVDDGDFTQTVVDLFSNANVKEVGIVASLPTTGDYIGEVVFLTTDSQLYRWTGTSWTTAVPAVNVTGQLTDSQLAAISAAKLTGQITETQITDDAITTPKIAAGAVNTAELAAGAVTTATLAANAVTAAQIAAGTVTATEIAGNTITGNKIVANTITGGLLNTAGIITTAAQIDDGVIENAAIANAAITTAKINDANVTTLKIADNAVTIPEGNSGSVSVTLSSTQTFIGRATLSYGSVGANPTAAIAIAGVQVDGSGSTDQTLSCYLRRVYVNGSYNGIQGATSVASNFGAQAIAAGKFTIAQVGSATSVTFDVYADVNTGSRTCNRFFVAVMSSKK